MDKNVKVKIMSGIAVLMVAASPISLCTLDVYAEGINTSEKSNVNGTFIDETLEYEESQYRQYVVKKGDNASSISRKICKYYNQEPTTKYWTVVAFLNNFPRVLQPGDVVIFPGTFEDMENLWKNLKSVGWIDNYSNRNKIYEKHSEKLTLGGLLSSIYGIDCVDIDFVNKYLKALGISGKYNIDTIVEDNNDVLFELTDWIPTLDEINDISLSKTKTKNK